MAVPYTFANATTSIPLSQLDNNFATAITIGNTSVQLGNTVTTLNNMTLANVTISSVSTPLTVAQGGTGLSTATAANNAIYSTGATTLTAGTLPVAAGGTGLTTATAANNAIYSTGATTLTAGTLPVAAGGTGSTTLTAENVMVGNGTNAVKFVAPGTNGNVLTSNGSSWVSQAAGPASGNVTIGNTTINLGGTATTVGNLTLTNATLSSLSTPVTVAQGGTGATTLTSNNVILGNGTSAVQFVAPGTSGNVLSSNGTSWVSTAAAGGGSMIYISTVTASGSSTVDFTSLSSTYDVYVVQAVTVRSDNNPDAMLMRIQASGSWNNGPYYHGVTWGQGSNTSTYSSYATYSAGGIFITNTNTIGSSSAFAFGFTMYIYAPSSTRAKLFTWEGSISGTPSYTATGSGSWDDGNFVTMTGIRFQMASGLTYGTFRLYGIKKS